MAAKRKAARKAAKTTKTAKAASTAKTMKPTKAASTAKASKVAKTAKASKIAKTAKVAKVAKTAKPAKTKKTKKTTTTTHAAKATKVQSRPSGSDRVVEIRPARGDAWTLFLASGARVDAPSAAAQTAGVRVGRAWNDAMARRVAAAAHSQELFVRAMDFLARNGKATAAQVVAALGGGRDAAQTAKSLAEHGWLRR